MATVESALIEKILNTPTRLSDDQKEAVLSKSRYNRVIAGAGAGKTETLTRRIVYLLAVGVWKLLRLLVILLRSGLRDFLAVGEIVESGTAILVRCTVDYSAYPKVLEDHFRFVIIYQENHATEQGHPLSLRWLLC